jgi:hypothetical protein
MLCRKKSNDKLLESFCLIWTEPAPDPQGHPVVFPSLFDLSAQVASEATWIDIPAVPPKAPARQSKGFTPYRFACGDKLF